jgi:hypothetical protein
MGQAVAVGRFRGKAPIVLAVPPGSLSVAGKQCHHRLRFPTLQRQESRRTTDFIFKRSIVKAASSRRCAATLSRINKG